MILRNGRWSLRTVYYSLVNVPEDSREQQWIQSIRSLRLYNQSIPVRLVLFNGASSELLREAERRDVQVHFLGDYGEFLQKAHLKGAVLALYPTFHKFLVLPNLPLQDLAQLLYIDCDTFFFDDVNLLFDQHTKHHWYAREEPMSLRCQGAYDPSHIDELLLKYIARSEGLRYIPPFNSGVCLLNREIWRSLGGLRDAYLSLAWRLLCGRELNEREGRVHDPRMRRTVLDASTDVDRSEALPYPSANGWIIEQIALWLALGRLPHFSLGTLSASQVLQGDEFQIMLSSGHRYVLAHYFGVMEKQFFSCVTPL